ncbi:hypothetical protein D9931_25805, partial [Salmonella enterica]|nr:hypothetical protein [Salmonella enterica]
PDDKIQSIVLRLLFCGKTETLTATFNKNFKKIVPVHFATEISNFRNDFTMLGYLTEKTSGWVTKFFDFSINEIEKNSADIKGFHDEFRLIFSELSSILDRLRFR